MNNGNRSGAVGSLTLGAPDGLEITVLDIGAAVQSLTVPTERGPLDCVVGYPDASSYFDDPWYVGAMVGRYANRIRAGKLEINGIRHQLDTNEEKTGNCLHGGRDGFHRKRWILEKDGRSERIICRLESPDGDQGFPGNLDVMVAYELTANLSLTIEVRAKTDATTALNLAQHPYFNLESNSPTINNHQLRIFADSFTPVDNNLIPTGEIRSLGNTRFDYRELRRIGDERLDHNFVLATGEGGLVSAAELYSPISNIGLKIRTTHPGLQVYSGDHLGSPFTARGGIALEAQNYPDAPNQPSFPSAILSPGEEYLHRTEYEFSVS